LERVPDAAALGRWHRGGTARGSIRARLGSGQRQAEQADGKLCTPGLLFSVWHSFHTLQLQNS